MRNYYNNKAQLVATVNENSGDGYAYIYDAQGKLTGVRPAKFVSESSYLTETDAENVIYTYDERNLLSTITTGSTVYTFYYDSFGNSTSIKAGDNTLASYEYNDYNGKLNKLTYANGLSEEYVYNSLDMLEEVWYTLDGERTLAYKYSYASNGALLEFEDCLTGDVTYYTYTKSGQLQSVNTYNKNNELSRYSVYCRYDEAKNFLEYTCVTLSYLSGVEVRESSYWTRYEYNNDDLLWLYWIYLPKETTGLVWFDYDESGRLTEKEINFDNGTSSFDNQIEITYKTSNNTSLSTMVDSYKSTVGTQETVYTYTYDDNGNIIRVYYSNGNEITYEYDNLGQLKRENNTIINRTYKYEYDNAGNIILKSEYAYTPANVEPTELIYSYTYVYSNGAWGDQLTSFNGNAIDYDALGNPTSYYNGADFDWIGRRLVGATYGNKEISFTYDDNGIRQSKTVNGVTTNYYWLGSMLVAEETEGVCTVYLYDNAGAPIGFQYRAPYYPEDVWDTFLYEKNLHGDIIAVYNIYGAKLVSYTYDAWGNFTTSYHVGGMYTPAASNHYTYRGYYYDTDLGLYYLQSRYYDANIGRFISPDTSSVITATPTALTDKNLYAYCDNNPVMRVDEGGEFWDILFGAVVGAVANVIGQGISDAVTSFSNGKVTISDWTVYFGAFVGGAVGGAVGALFKNSYIGNIASSAVTTVVSEVTHNIKCAILGKGDMYSFEEIFYDTFNNTIVAAVVSGGGSGFNAFDALGKRVKEPLLAAFTTIGTVIKDAIEERWPSTHVWER